jgi:hypothetical protein
LKGTLDFILVFYFTCIISCASAQEFNAWTDRYFQQARSGAGQVIPIVMPDSAKSTALISIKPFLRDSNDVVRARACKLIYNIAISAADSTRREGVNILAETCAVGDPATAATALQFLKKFSKGDFTIVARNRLASTFNSNAAFATEWIKLAGFLQLTELEARVRSFSLPGHRHALRWAALLALARMGDTLATTEVVSRAKRLPVDDDVIYNILPDLIFTRQRSAFDYMIQLLNERAANCHTADAEREVAIPCGYRIMELLAPVIHDYPLKIGEWGDIETTNYPAALEQTREWFATNDNYIIMTERY